MTKTRKIRWWVYNAAFCVFGHTPLWPKLGFILW